MKNLILKDIQDGVCTITLNNPRKKNALSLALLKELGRNLEFLQNDKNLKSIILQGADGSFSVGADLSDITGTVADQKIDDLIVEVCKLLQGLNVPCIAAIEGPCVGGASEDSFFEIPALRLGLLYNPDSVERLYARLGSASITRLLLFGERWNAETALHSGLVAKVVPEGAAHKKALEIVKNFEEAPIVISSTKSLIFALEKGEKNLSYWREIRNEILNSSERIKAVNKAKKKLGINKKF